MAPSEGRDLHIPRGPLVVVRLLPLADGELNKGSGASLTDWIVWSGKVRSSWLRSGEFAAAVELRRLFPGITDNVQARECARTIAGWKPLPLRPMKRAPRLRRIV